MIPLRTGSPPCPETTKNPDGALVGADEPVITQVDDGETPSGGVDLRPSSSCSQPSLVAVMLDVREGHRVLEIGTDTGLNAALLSERVGDSGYVVSIEVDGDVTDTARGSLARAGYGLLVVTGDGAKGYQPDAPYDRFICTASVRKVPRAWIDQTRPGGLLVTPWGTDYGDDALTRLEVHQDGSASGRCGMNLAFMRVRHQPRDFLDPAAEEISAADQKLTSRSGRELFEMVTFSQAAFTIGLRVPNCYATVEDMDDNHRRIKLHDVRSQSWANVSLVRRQHRWTVHELGPRRLWDEVDAAYDWWLDVGKPTPDRHGLTARRTARTLCGLTRRTVKVDGC